MKCQMKVLGFNVIISECYVPTPFSSNELFEKQDTPKTNTAE
jgi:hypothetical protein